MCQQSIAVHHLSVDKSFLEITVNLASCFLSVLSSSDGPCPDFIRSNSVEMTQLQLIISSIDDFLYFRFLIFLNILFMLNTELNDWSFKLSVFCDQI
jgi:hypothetical protein